VRDSSDAGELVAEAGGYGRQSSGGNNAGNGRHDAAAT